MTPTQPMIFLLVGPKGAGKTYLGTKAAEKLGLSFLRVEPIWLTLKNEGKFTGDAYDTEGQRRVLKAVAKQISSHPQIILETTGAAPWFPSFIDKLRKLGQVVTIRVSAPLDLCLKRVQTRDQTHHIPVSDDRVLEINKAAINVQFNWDIEIVNTDPDSEPKFISALRNILKNTQNS